MSVDIECSWCGRPKREGHGLLCDPCQIRHYESLVALPDNDPLVPVATVRAWRTVAKKWLHESRELARDVCSCRPSWAGRFICPRCLAEPLSEAAE